MDEGLVHAIQDNLSLQFRSQREIKLLYSLLERESCLHLADGDTSGMCHIIPRLREDRPGKKIKVNLFCGEDDRLDKGKDDPAFIISDTDDLIDLIYRKRPQIEEGFRDLKSLFGFRHLVLKKPTQERVEMMFLLVIMAMGLQFSMNSSYSQKASHSSPFGMLQCP